MQHIRDDKGFTLIELMIVVVIIGILAAIAIPRFTDVAASARQAEAEPILKQIATMQDSYRARTGSYAIAAGWADSLASVGYENPSANLKHFQNLDVVADSSGFCAVAEALDSDLEDRSVNASGRFFSDLTCTTALP